MIPVMIFTELGWLLSRCTHPSSCIKASRYLTSASHMLWSFRCLLVAPVNLSLKELLTMLLMVVMASEFLMTMFISATTSMNMFMVTMTMMNTIMTTVTTTVITTTMNTMTSMMGTV